MNDLNLLSYLKKLSGKQPGKRLLGGEARWLTAAEVLRRVDALGRRLVSLGLRPGELAALRCDRCADTAVMILALRAAGICVVLTDPRQSFGDALSACDAALSPRLRIEHETDGAFLAQLDGTYYRLSLDDPAPAAALPETGAKDAAFLIFTSGSTGKSKAVVLSEHNLISNLLDSQPLGLYSESDIALGALPLAHVFGLVLLAGTVVLSYALFFPAKTDISSLLSCIEREKITRMNGVPSLYLALAEHSAEYDLSSLRAGFIGGGPVTPEQFVRAEKALGMTLIPVYGMSECIGISCAGGRDPQPERASGVGRVYPMNEVRLLTADGQEARIGQQGEICVRGPMRMLGYYGQAMPADAFFPTGDLGWLDESGILHLSGRKKEIIIRNGNNLSARHIEAALLQLPGVREAAVVGLPDEKQGEAPWAMVVGAADEAALHALLQKNEWPAGILTVEKLPALSSGKPDRQTIREVLLQWRSS